MGFQYGKSGKEMAIFCRLRQYRGNYYAAWCTATSNHAKMADLVQNKPDVDWFGQFYDWLVKGEEPPKTKQDLIEFGDSIGLEPGDIATALKEADLDWDPANWAEITNVVTIFAEGDNTLEEEEIPEA